MQKHNIVCFIGHRKIERTNCLEDEVFKVVEDLIVSRNVDTFLFGSRSEFNDLCYEIVSKLKENRHANIKRIYVRGEYQYIDDRYKEVYFLKGFEESYLSKKCKVGSKASYLQRNYEMIDKSDFCVFYFDKNYIPEQKELFNKGICKGFLKRTSGTKLAFDYAVKRKKKIINIKEIGKI